MHLISPWHDYYDIHLAYGQDENVRFLRQTTQTSQLIDHLPWSRVSPYQTASRGLRLYVHPSNSPRATLRLEEAFVVVAGKAHATWILKGENNQSIPVGSPFFIGHPDINKALRLAVTSIKETWPHAPLHADQPGAKLPDCMPTLEGLKEIHVESLAVRKLETKTRLRLFHQAEARKDEVQQRDWTDMCVDMETPVVLLMALPRGWGETSCQTLVVRNPKLADLHLQTVLTPQEAFQQISQFLSGVLPDAGKQMVHLNDKEKLAKSGFDPTYGFRTRPHM